MINGRFGMVLMIGLAVFLPLERWQVAGLIPADLILLVMIDTAWPLLLRDRVRVRFPLALGVWLILMGGLIGALSVLDVGKASIALVQEVYLFLVFVTLVNAFISKEAFLKFVKVWVMVAAVETVLLLTGRFRLVPAFLGGAIEGKPGDPSEFGHALGTFLNSNAAGAYLLLSFFLLLAIPFPRNRLMRGALLVLYVAGIFGSGSNAALMGLVFGTAVATVYWLHHRGRALLFSVGLVSALVVLAIPLGLFLYPLLPSSIGSAEKGDLLFAFGRVVEKLEKRGFIWQVGFEAFGDYPLGIGPNVSKSATGLGLHSDYIAFMVERGALGFIGLILIFGEVFFWLALAGREAIDRNHFMATGALLGALVGVLAAAASHEITHGRPVWLIFVVIYLHYKFLNTKAEPVGPVSRVRILTGVTGAD